MQPDKVQRRKTATLQTRRVSRSRRHDATPNTRPAGTPVTKTAGAYKAGAQGGYIFPLWELSRVAAGGKPGDAHYYADTRAAVVEGTRMQVGLAFEQRGCGSAPHSHPNEQFNLILQGKVRVKIGDLDEMIVTKGSVVHFPANVVHSQVALPDEDVVFYVVKDLTHGIVGIPAAAEKTTKSRPKGKRRGR